MIYLQKPLHLCYLVLISGRSVSSIIIQAESGQHLQKGLMKVFRKGLKRLEPGSASRKRAYVNMTFIMLNVLFFLFLEVKGSTEDAYFMYENGAVYAPAILEQGEYYRLLTAVFMHFGISHIQQNMLVLFILGDNLERALGHVKYFFFYLFCGIGANVVSLFVNGNRLDVVSAGASGAIFGVIGGLLYIVTVNRGRLEDLNTLQLAVMVFFSLYSGIKSTGIDHVAHVSGVMIGAVLGFILYKDNSGRTI